MKETEYKGCREQVSEENFYAHTHKFNDGLFMLGFRIQ
jgi:hypothetical protein